MKKEITQEEVDMDAEGFYCIKCGGCGFIGCCGIRNFLEKHVKGKTDCNQEGIFIQEIIDYIENTDDYKLNHD